VGTDRTHVWGYLHNTYGDSFGDVLLLAQALDGSGALVDQRVVRLPGIVSAFSRAYFDIGTLRAASHYRVTVWSFSPLQAPGWPD
jgi:hypothetical protein